MKQKIINLFGAIGYLNCFLSWFWVGILYLNKVIESPLLIQKIPDKPKLIVAPPSTPVNQSSILLAIIITILIVVIVVYVMFKIPKSIAKTSKNIVHQTALKTVPVISRISHKKISKQKQLKLTPKIVFSLKLSLIIIPILIAWLSKSVAADNSIDYSIVLTISLALSGLSLLFFGIQYILAYILKIKPNDIW